MSTLPHTHTDSIQAPLVGVSPKKWSRDEYYQLGEQGYFEGQRVELVAGEIVMMSPQSFPHAFSGDGIAELLRQAFGSGYWVRHQLPLHISEDSEPEPDVSVVAGRRLDFTDHPRTAVLVVEVARASLDYDTQTKPGLYASAGIAEYWVLDLVNRRLIVHRDPVADSGEPFGHRYKSVQTLGEDASVAPLERPDSTIAVAQMLPPA